MNFIENKYTRIYFAIINNALQQNRKKLIRNNPTYIYYEKHHIIPKSLNGDNNLTNLVLLTAQEHFIAHRLLCKMTVGLDKCKMHKAIHRMTSSNKFQPRHKVTARTYELIRINANNAQSITKKGVTAGSKNGMFGKKHKLESINLMKINSEGKNSERIHLLETKDKIAASLRNVAKSADHKLAIKEGWHRTRAQRSGINHPMHGKIQEKVQCPHCGIFACRGMFARWHGDNCRTLNTT